MSRPFSLAHGLPYSIHRDVKRNSLVRLLLIQSCQRFSITNTALLSSISSECPFWYFCGHFWLSRHASNVEDPYLRTKWNKCKKDLMEEFNIVKQIDAERQAFRDAPGAQPRPASPQLPAPSQQQSQPYFPVEEIYVPHVASHNNGSRMGSEPMDDPDVWRPPARDAPMQYGSRRPTKAGQMAAAAQAKRMASYARGGGDKSATPQIGRSISTKMATTGPSAKGIGASAGMGVKGTSSVGGAVARKSTGRSTPNKRESLVCRGKIFDRLQGMLYLLQLIIGMELEMSMCMQLNAAASRRLLACCV